MPDRLPDPIADDLVRPGASLGRLLATHQLETRRAILEVVGVRAAEAGDHLGVATNASVARRTYAIIIGQQAVAAVTEWISPGHLAAMARVAARRTASRNHSHEPANVLRVVDAASSSSPTFDDSSGRSCTCGTCWPERVKLS